MAIDGFSPEHHEAFVAFSRERTRQVCEAIDAIGQRLGAHVSGIEKLPAGRALIVANHAFGFDVAFPMAAIFRATGRVVWSLGEHAWWKFPGLRRVVASVGVVDGTQANADRLLSRDELLLVLPGGLRESMKPRELRYRLLWGHRYGFVRTAIANGAPVVPLACVGADEILDLVGNPFDRGKRWLGRFAFPIPRPWAGVPIVHRVALRYAIGDPIHLSATPEEADDPRVLRRCRHEIAGALHELIDVELARRAGFDVDVEPGAPDHAGAPADPSFGADRVEGPRRPAG